MFTATDCREKSKVTRPEGRFVGLERRITLAQRDPSPSWSGRRAVRAIIFALTALNVINGIPVPRTPMARQAIVHEEQRRRRDRVPR
jgi:hypothetical protein